MIQQHIPLYGCTLFQ